MATHSTVLAWRIPGTGEPGGLPSMGLHRVGHDWSDLVAAAAAGLFFVFIFWIPKYWVHLKCILIQDTDMRVFPPSWLLWWSNIIFLVIIYVCVSHSVVSDCNSMDSRPLGSSNHGILQARILEWVAISLSRGFSWPRDWTQVSYIACWFFNHLSHHGSSLLSIVPVDLCTLIIYQISLATFKWWLLLV